MNLRFTPFHIALLVHILAIPFPLRALQTTVGGRAIELDGHLSVREVFESNRSTTHDRTQEMLHLRAAVELTSWLRIEGTTVGINGGPTFKATKSGTFNLDDVFQDVSPSVELEEVFLDMHLDALDLRLGKQKLAWGKLDRHQPNDLINPERFVDLFMQEEDERKIGVPAVQASYYFPERDWLPEESQMTLVWVPVYVPFRFPAAGERWFPPAVTPADQFSVPAGVITLPDGSPSPAFTVPLSLQTLNTSPPARRLENSSVALRWSGRLSRADVSAYYYHGFDTQPAFVLEGLASGEPDDDPENPLGVTNLAAQTILTPVFRSIDAWGADFACVLDAFTVRAEGAYISGRPFIRDVRFLITDPNTLAPQIREALQALRQGAGQVPIDLGPSFVTRDAVEWGLGVDYAAAGYLLLFQLNQTDVLNNDRDLLIEDVETRLLANLRKTFLADRLQTQLIAVHGLESDYTILLPRLTYRVTDTLDLRIGYLFIAGRSSSVGGQYKRNDQGFVRLRYSF